MSNALALAHVTQALALLIEANLPPDIDIAVKVEPRRPPVDPPLEPTITVFLYQVTPNTSQRNNDLPTRASDGTLVRRPAAALDLHYLISAYGEEAELVGQRLIGSVVRTLHEKPVLPRDIIELAGQRPHLNGSDLAGAVQRVRFTPTAMDVDETSKLWGMLHQTPYALSVVYQAVLVLIDGRETPVPAKPVERPEVRVLPFGAPSPGPVPDEPAAPPSQEAEQPADPPTKVVARTEAKTPAKTARSRKAAQPARSAKKTAAKSAKSARTQPASRHKDGNADAHADGSEGTEN
ncbi:Pvc16 family protein [Streptomyces luteogriseus]|uniref:Pvc16 family protein n=1 Tax=Streptomyces luteogriseus TaxID=68233 RepID=UPI00378A1431